MWKFPPLVGFLDYMVRLDVIQEVIVIDNQRSNRPEHRVFSHPKMRCFDFGKNIFVNPAWNYGANASRADKICIMNDDIIFDLKLFYSVEDFFQPHHGTIGLLNGRTEFGQTPVTTGAIGFEPFHGQSCYGYGNLFFTFRDNWPIIPPGLDIWFGDVFVFEWFLFQNYQIHLINNTFNYHSESKTVATIDYSGIPERENIAYDNVRAQMLDGKFSNFRPPSK